MPPIDRPCARSWDDLDGDGPVRWCRSCERPVHDLESLDVLGRATLMASRVPVCVRAVVPALLAVSGVAHAEPDVLPGEGPLPVVEEARTIMGALSTEWIRAMIRRRTDALRDAYAVRLAERPELAGTIVVRFVMQDGRVTEVSVPQDDVGDEPLRDAVVAIVRTLEPGPMPPHGASIAVSYPFRFEREPTPPPEE